MTPRVQIIERLLVYSSVVVPVGDSRPSDLVVECENRWGDTRKGPRSGELDCLLGIHDKIFIVF